MKMNADMKDLIIVCEDSFGMDVYSIVGAINGHPIKGFFQNKYLVIGYLMPKDRMTAAKGLNLPVLGSIEDWVPREEECYAMAIVDPRRKEWAVEVLKGKKAHFVTLRAPWVLAPWDIKYGEGSIISAVSIKEGVKVGAFSLIFESMVAAAVVEDYCSVMSFANITNAHLKKRAYVGDNASVMMDLTVGEDACVLPNSVVVRDVKPGAKVFGIPARRVKE